MGRAGRIGRRRHGLAGAVDFGERRRRSDRRICDHASRLARALQKVLEGHPHTEWGGTIEILEFLALPSA